MGYNRTIVYFIMGVSGVGKTTIGNLLSKEFSFPFFDGDDFHPEENIKKMASGIPLTDNDRFGWLKKINHLAKKQLESNSCIIACSALKESYREILSNTIEANTKWVFLNGTYEQILVRLRERKGHFMQESLLKSQFETLESPINAFKINIELSPKEIIKKIKEEFQNKTDFGLIGLGVMGKSLARNLARNNFFISVYNRHVAGKEENVATNFKKEFAELASTLPFDDLKKFIASLQTPRKIMLMVNAGKTVDTVIDSLLPFLSENDIIIDGGNSHFKDTERRILQLSKKYIYFIGCGISGGEEGALNGPSIMPGGNRTTYNIIKPFLEGIAAKDKNNSPCCSYIGKNGSGHYVKMIHNGIEYAEMQLLAEIYSILKHSGNNPTEISEILNTWRASVDSFLLDITTKILIYKEDNNWLINKILDKAGNKGTGNWAIIETSKLGVPSTMFSSALFARYLSSFKDERFKMEKLYRKNDSKLAIDTNELKKAYKLARVINHHQGFKLLNEASKTYKWNLNLSEIARIWTNGCIIRSSLMEQMATILSKSENILLHPAIAEEVNSLKISLTNIVSECILQEIPIPCFSDAINFLNGYSEALSSANIIQAQRDFFGAHTYQRIDNSQSKFYHTNWNK